MPFSIGEGIGSRSNAQPIAPPTSQNAAGKGEFHMDAVTTIDLSKIYGKRTALHAVDLSVPEGAIFGLLGTKQSGRTTLIRILCGLLPPTQGRATVLQLSPQKETGKLHTLCGVTSASANLYGQMSGLDNLLFFSSFYQISPADARERATYLMKELDLWDLRDTLVSAYSPGAKERLSLARAVLHRPKILFRDEPADAIDIESAERITALLASLNREEGMTIFLSANMLGQAQSICTAYGILQRGTMTAQGTYEALWRAAGLSLSAEIRTVPEPSDSQAPQDGWLIRPISSESEMPLLIKQLLESGKPVFEARIVRPSLSEIFSAHTQPKEALL